MRSYAQGSRSDCDDLIEQKPPRVRLHMRIFANEDHRKMNASPKRRFASSRGKGYYSRPWEKRLILLYFIITRIIGYLLFSFALTALKTWTIHIPHLTVHYVNLRWGLTLLSGLRPDKNPREFIHDEFIRSKT